MTSAARTPELGRVRSVDYEELEPLRRGGHRVSPPASGQISDR